MPEGVIFGGWSYVVAAYSITAAVLIGYALHLRAARRRIDRGGRPS